jgi:hypothetical protein
MDIGGLPVILQDLIGKPLQIEFTFSNQSLCTALMVFFHLRPLRHPFLA